MISKQAKDFINNVDTPGRVLEINLDSIPMSVLIEEYKKKINEDNSIDLTIQERMKVLKSEYPLETLKTILNGK